jgi:hypothetical protein
MSLFYFQIPIFVAAPELGCWCAGGPCMHPLGNARGWARAVRQVAMTSTCYLAKTNFGPCL